MKKEGIKILTKLGILGAEKLIDNAPEIIGHLNKKKEEKSFLEENKSWIFMIILSIFVTNLNYFVIFENLILQPLK